ncbi:MAG: histidinol-phosphate transaminase [Gaiellales bacterium]|nr:MAG: histidinol-phosphate transaminase [Gaiellales bacterium]
MRFVKNIDRLEPYVGGTPIEVVARQYGLDEVIKLASNESPVPPFPEVIDVINEKFQFLNRYPDAECRELRQALAERFAVTPEQVTVGNGSCELLYWLSMIMLEPGDEAVFSDPAFLVYESVTRARGAVPVKVPLRGFANDIEGMAAAVNDRTRIIFLTNPHNPTGSYAPYSEIAAFAAGLPQDCLLVLDEAYNEYVEEDDSQQGIELFRRHENVVVTRTFSKIYGLCGLRVGYGLCPADVRDAIDKVRQPFNVNMLGQAAAMRALELEGRLEERRQMNREGRNQLYEGLAALEIGYVETQSNFMLVDVRHLSLPADEVPQELMRRGVIVRPGKPLACPGFIRVSVGTPAENKTFLRRLGEIKSGS